MSNDKKAPADTEAAAGLEAEIREAAEEGATEIMTCMSAVLSAAIGSSNRPGLALTAMQLALHGLRAAVLKTQQLTPEEATAAVGFADRSFLDDHKGTTMALAMQHIDHRATVARPSSEDVENTVVHAKDCLEDMQRRGNSHPITQLVILHTTRQLVLALMKHHYPDDHEEMLSVARAMENGMQPRQVEVVEIPAQSRMSKGGSA